MCFLFRVAVTVLASGIATGCKGQGNTSVATTADASSLSSCKTPTHVTVDVSVKGAGRSLAGRTPYPFSPAAITLRIESTCPTSADASGTGVGLGVEDERTLVVIGLPRFPGVTFEDPKELCSAELIARKLDVDCLSDEGTRNHASVELEPLLRKFAPPDAPFVVENRVGARNMQRLLAGYVDARGDCPETERRSPLDVALQLGSPNAASGRVDIGLHVPELGVHRSLGFTTAIGPCVWAPLKARAGMCGGCWTDEGWGGALVYQIGPTLFHYLS